MHDCCSSRWNSGPRKLYSCERTFYICSLIKFLPVSTFLLSIFGFSIILIFAQFFFYFSLSVWCHCSLLLAGAPMKKLLSFLTYICQDFRIAMSYLSNYSVLSNCIGFRGQNPSFHHLKTTLTISGTSMPAILLGNLSLVR